MQLFSSGFKEGHNIPAPYTCAGEDHSPPLNWENVPQQAVSFVLLCEEPQNAEGPWVHWLVYNLPVEIRNLEAGEALSLECLGFNSWERQNYSGPCPPHTKEHDTKQRYVFHLYALDSFLSLAHLGRPPYRAEVEKAMEGHVLAQSSLFGHFHRAHEGFEWPHPGQKNSYHRPPV